jgi:UDP-N-acetylmuramoyl-L-alanyl-D-glutamate-L-lysine ligase
MENYARAKKKLFDYVLRNKKSQKFAVFPKDDSYGRKWTEDMPFDKKITYGLHGSSVLQADKLSEKIDGTQFRLSYLGKEYEVDSPLVGAYNVSNVLAAMAVLVEM